MKDSALLKQEAILKDLENSVSTLKTIDKLRYIAVPATAIAAIASPVAFATVAGLSAVTLGIGAWKAHQERGKLLNRIDLLKKENDTIDNVRLNKLISTANRIAVGGSAE